MNRLVVISNRVFSPNSKDQEASGGLGVGLLEALSSHGGSWLGWSGEVVENSSEQTLNLQEKAGVTYATISLEKSDYDGFYNLYSNGTLWPLFHYRLDLVQFSDESYHSYRKVNKFFAEQLYSILKSDDLVWVHDYHFIPLASELRKKRCSQKMGFFLHVPWPAREVFLALPNHRELVESLLEYDLIGFQTKGHIIAFMDYIVTELGGVVDADGLIYVNGKRTKVKHFPISIDFKKFVSLSDESKQSKTVQRLSKSLEDSKLILGVDRLDYSKGLLNRLHSYELLLQRYPKHKRFSTFMQIAPTSRSDALHYGDMRRAIETKAGHINGLYSDFDWVPVRYLNKAFNRRILAGFFRQSRVGLVTPFRDGMNLVAKEFVAAQSVEDPGVLVLSRFAGAAEEMLGALQVNPYDPVSVSTVLNEALEMSLKERRYRWVRMYEQIEANDLTRWWQNFISELNKT